MPRRPGRAPGRLRVLSGRPFHGVKVLVSTLFPGPGCGVRFPRPVRAGGIARRPDILEQPRTVSEHRPPLTCRRFVEGGSVASPQNPVEARTASQQDISAPAKKCHSTPDSERSRRQTRHRSAKRRGEHNDKACALLKCRVAAPRKGLYRNRHLPCVTPPGCRSTVMTRFSVHDHFAFLCTRRF